MSEQSSLGAIFDEMFHQQNGSRLLFEALMILWSKIDVFLAERHISIKEFTQDNQLPPPGFLSKDTDRIRILLQVSANLKEINPSRLARYASDPSSVERALKHAIDQVQAIDSKNSSQFLLNLTGLLRANSEEMLERSRETTETLERVAKYLGIKVPDNLDMN